jgi:hypothetical protein
MDKCKSHNKNFNLNWLNLFVIIFLYIFVNIWVWVLTFERLNWTWLVYFLLLFIHFISACNTVVRHWLLRVDVFVPFSCFTFNMILKIIIALPYPFWAFVTLNPGFLILVFIRLVRIHLFAEIAIISIMIVLGTTIAKIQKLFL